MNILCYDILFWWGKKKEREEEEETLFALMF
jgi:hypothetical protein